MNIPDLPELTFDDKNHIYRLNGAEIPSVSSLMEPITRKVYGSIDTETLAKAASKGTIVHDAIHSFLEYGIIDVPDILVGYFEAFRDWAEKEKPEIIATERRVYHKQFAYAGTSDLICIIKSVPTLVDYKTSYKTQPALHAIQLEAYARAWESQGVKIEDRITLHLKKERKYTVEHYPKSIEHYTVVQALTTLYNYQKKI